MGCFNITGFHTQIPLTIGDKAFIIPGIYRPKNKRNEFSQGTIFSPIALPIFGEYDDYGLIENIETNRNTKQIEDIFGVSIQEFLKVIDDKSVDRYSSSSKKYTDIVESYLDHCRKHKSPSWFNENTDLITFTLDHRFFYESCCTNNFSIETFNTYEMYTKLFKKLYEEKSSEYSTLLKSYKSKINKDVYDKLKNASNSIYSIYSLAAEIGFPSLDPNLRVGWYFGSGYAAYHNSSTLLSLYIGKGSDYLFTDLKEDYRKFLSFFETFSEHSWIIDMHNYCSQEDCTSTLLPIYEKMVEFIKEKKDKNESWE